VPRRDFVQVHRERAESGYFLSGGYIKLPMACSDAIDKDHITSGDAFNIHWLKLHGYPASAKKARLIINGLWAKLLDALVTARKTWNGNNSSGWKYDILKINGFDERMQSGGQAVEMGFRLKY